jgi:TonB family protein
MPQTRSDRRAAVLGGLCLILAGCGRNAERDLKTLRTQIQDRYGAKDFAKGYELSVKALTLARETLGDKNPETLYFAQAVSENALGARKFKVAQEALKVELDLRSRAGQSEEKLQRRRTMLIKLAEESGDKTTAIEQTVIVAKAIGMGSGKDPQPTYRPESEYPPDLYKQRVEGDVELGFSLDANGTPAGVRVIRATPPNVFDSVAVENLKRWRFTPFIENGQPVASTGHHFTLAFRMQRERPPAN